MSDFIEEKVEPIDCICGSYIEKITIGFGRTPYIIHCHNCGLSLDYIIPRGIGYGLNIKHAIEAFTDYVDAVQWFRDERRIWEPTQNQIREYFYRKMKGWSQNP